MRQALAIAALLAGSAMLTSGCDKAKQVITGKTVVAETAFPERVYWGDTHLHTSNSPDAFGFGNRLGPEEALRFASGEKVTSSTGIKAQLKRPLDFLVVTDHSDGFGTVKDLYNAPRALIKDPQLLRWYDMLHAGPKESMQVVREVDRKSTRLNSSHPRLSRMPSSA